MNQLELLCGRENEAPNDNYTAEFDSAAPFPASAMYDRLRQAAVVEGRLNDDMTVHEAHSVFVDVFGEGISLPELARAKGNYADKQQQNQIELCRSLTDAYTRDYAKNADLAQQIYDLIKWKYLTGTLAATDYLAPKLETAVSKAREKAGAVHTKLKEVVAEVRNPYTPLIPRR